MDGQEKSPPVGVAQRYHEAVAHSRGRLSGHRLDWANKPAVFKEYVGLPRYALPRQMDVPPTSLWGVLGTMAGALGHGSRSSSADGSSFSVEALSAVLYHAAGITRVLPRQQGEFSLRACPSAGALYPCEMYLSWPGSDLLAAGLYHYGPARHELVRLRQGGVDAGSFGMPGPSGEAGPSGEVLVFCTTIFFRSAWKYRARAYRYVNLDCGHVTEGLCLGLAAYGVEYSVEQDFADEAVNAYLGVDPEREGCLAVIRVGAGLAAPETLQDPPNVAGRSEQQDQSEGVELAGQAGHELQPEESGQTAQTDQAGQPGQTAQTAQLGQTARTAQTGQTGQTGQPGQGSTPAVGALPAGMAALSRMAAADSLPQALTRIHQAASVLAGLPGGVLPMGRESSGAPEIWSQPPQGPGPDERLGMFPAMAARRSRRDFVPMQLPEGTLAKIVAVLCAPMHPAGPRPSAHSQPAGRACRVGFLAGEAVRVPEGFYMLDRETGAISRRRSGNMRSAMASVCLDQSWMVNAALHVLFLADLPELEHAFGARGYRRAQQAAGRLGHRLYLAAESLGLGACGVGAFFDAEATEALSLHGGEALLYVLALGGCKAGGTLQA